jgi:hypothetical protein
LASRDSRAPCFAAQGRSAFDPSSEFALVVFDSTTRQIAQSHETISNDCLELIPPGTPVVFLEISNRGDDEVESFAVDQLAGRRSVGLRRPVGERVLSP